MRKNLPGADVVEEVGSFPELENEEVRKSLEEAGELRIPKKLLTEQSSSPDWAAEMLGSVTLPPQRFTDEKSEGIIYDGSWLNGQRHGAFGR